MAAFSVIAAKWFSRIDVQMVNDHLQRVMWCQFTDRAVCVYMDITKMKYLPIKFIALFYRLKNCFVIEFMDNFLFKVKN